ncbi:MAG: YgjV family protein [Eubacterium sp.]|nr:YgjV family protein [Eubacterium sp.]
MLTTAMMIELFGYLGSLLVVISMLMTSVKRLRVVNTVGSVIFTTYALIIHSYPTALMNFALIIINVYHLIQLEKKDRHYDLIKVEAGAGMMKYLLDYYRDDILKTFKDVALDVSADCDEAYIVTCDTVPAGLLLGNRTDDGVVRIIIDYATPAYRDTSVGMFLYSMLSDYGIRRLEFSGRAVGHESYLKAMGFEKTDAGYVKEL